MNDTLIDFNNCCNSKQLSMLTAYEQNKIWYKYYKYKASQNFYNIPQSQILSYGKKALIAKQQTSRQYLNFTDEIEAVYEAQVDRFLAICKDYATGIYKDKEMKITFDLDKVLIGSFLAEEIKIEEFKDMQSKIFWEDNSVFINKIKVDSSDYFTFCVRKNGVNFKPLELKVVLISNIEFIDRV